MAGGACEGEPGAQGQGPPWRAAVRAAVCGLHDHDVCAKAHHLLQCETQCGSGKRGVWRNRQRLVKILITTSG